MSDSKEVLRQKVLDLLPAPISKIEVQKKRKHRYSVFVNNTFVVGISEHTLVSLNISKGTELTPSILDKITESENYHFAKHYILDLLGRRSHSKSELLSKSLRKGYHKDQLNDIIDELELKGYVNDQTFALAFTRDKLNAGKWGSTKIKTSLVQKGISSSIIKECQQLIEQEQDVSDFLIQTVQKNKRKFQRVEDLSKRKAKLYAFLLQRGVPSSHIHTHLNDLLLLIKTS